MSIKLYNDKSECSGCWACYNICPKNAISMVADEEGFKFPVADDSLCIECGVCLSVCPIRISRAKETEENSKKHIGIINLQNTNNYGATIAGAVLEDKVRELAGDDYIVNTVDYVPSRKLSNHIAQYKDEAKQWGGWKLYFKRIFSDASTELSFVSDKRFVLFRETFMNLTHRFQEASDIAGDVNYTHFIVGSDVIWAPKRSDNYRAEGYYLRFLDNSVKRISYAASIDHKADAALKMLSTLYKENISGFDYISLREKDSVDFIQPLTDKKVYRCVDPVLLEDSDYFDKFISISQEPLPEEKYIYVYILEINDEAAEYAKKLAKEKNLRIFYYSPNHSFFDNSYDCVSDGPAEFLMRLKNAEFVITNSYHCVVFSLLFKKQFLSFERSEISIKTRDLLEEVGLTERIFSGSEPKNEIDFSNVDNKLKAMRIASTEFLKTALDG